MLGVVVELQAADSADSAANGFSILAWHLAETRCHETGWRTPAEGLEPKELKLCCYPVKENTSLKVPLSDRSIRTETLAPAAASTGSAAEPMSLFRVQDWLGEANG